MKKSGFTLVEMLIYLGLLSLLIGIMHFSFIPIYTSLTKTDRNIAIEETGNFILQVLDSEIDTHSQLIFPTVSSSTPVSNIQIIESATSTIISFSIENHDFNITRSI